MKKKGDKLFHHRCEPRQSQQVDFNPGLTTRMQHTIASVACLLTSQHQCVRYQTALIDVNVSFVSNN